ncbi:hypothetical protein DBV15_11639 [Temnothorax longispinosus]|uniref:Uncharacterized protein n=1 Tax=Temnothorax longispinosus TaxID=300112 RepID=A0A4S2KWT5_9HYME|nr:hypothetical protein DBV15_11639 [Temnothorax longispinosus]
MLLDCRFGPLCAGRRDAPTLDKSWFYKIADNLHLARSLASGFTCGHNKHLHESSSKNVETI